VQFRARFWRTASRCFGSSMSRSAAWITSSSSAGGTIPECSRPLHGHPPDPRARGDPALPERQAPRQLRGPDAPRPGQRQSRADGPLQQRRQSTPPLGPRRRRHASGALARILIMGAVARRDAWRIATIPDRDCDVLVQACNRHRRRDPHNIKRGAEHPHKARRIRDGSHARNGPMDDSDPVSRRATLTLAEFAPHLAFSRFRCNPYCAWTVCQRNG
jgi:hypothetical protein